MRLNVVSRRFNDTDIANKRRCTVPVYSTDGLTGPDLLKWPHYHKHNV